MVIYFRFEKKNSKIFKFFLDISTNAIIIELVIYEIEEIKERTLGFMSYKILIGGGNMFSNLNAEIGRKNLTLKDIVKELRKRGFKTTIPSLSNKLNGKSKISFKEAKAIKEILNVDIPLEELFEEE